jgi:hypothetical protein
VTHRSGEGVVVASCFDGSFTSPLRLFAPTAWTASRIVVAARSGSDGIKGSDVGGTDAEGGLS